MNFPFYRQLDAMDCGPTCLRMIAKYYGRTITHDFLRKRSQYGKLGVSMLGLSEAAENIGLRSIGAKLTFEQLIKDAPLPAILHWDQYHFVVLVPSSNKNKLVVADPAKGIISFTQKEFLMHWLSLTEEGVGKGTALLLECASPFNQREDKTVKQKIGWSFLLRYLKENKASFFQIMLGFFMGCVIQLVLPFLTQDLVDAGINTQNLNFIQIILSAQMMLLFSQTMVEFIRNHILLHMSVRINVSLLSSFWSKLLRLPMAFFDSKHPGDIMQRIGDHNRIENFLTSIAQNTLLSIVNLIIFSIILLKYNATIFLIFLIGSILYFGWIQLFLRYRKKIDYKRFDIASKENNATMQLVYGMQEIKLNNAENTFRWAWEGLQASLFKLNFKSLSMNQYQQIGAFFINQGKNILITFLVAQLVIEGKLTLGAMLAIQYILGQLNSPIEQFISFSHQAQDAKISMERLNDIHMLEDEEPVEKHFNNYISEYQDIVLRNLSFTYPGAGNEPVLKNVNLTIPKGKITAIVGMSGSGKTTLVKLLLKFYDSYNGEIYLGQSNFKIISPKFWRSISGCVMQDNFIFNDNILKNITVADDTVDSDKLIRACRTANILSYIESLPLGFYTKLGVEGQGISGGQRQRIAIARAVYKEPHFIFFDEATNSLDANNEKAIIENLQEFFYGKTVVVVAHRLSTVTNADKIVVMNDGEVSEEGTHSELVTIKGQYYKLVKNQLELGN